MVRVICAENGIGKPCLTFGWSCLCSLIINDSWERHESISLHFVPLPDIFLEIFCFWYIMMVDAEMSILTNYSPALLIEDVNCILCRGIRPPSSLNTYLPNVTANLLESPNGTLLFARVKMGQTGTWSLVE